MKKECCEYCRKKYPPDPRSYRVDDHGRRYSTQRSCKKKRCRKKRKEDAHAAWRETKPDYFRRPAHRERQKKFLAENPGYLRRYRKKNPEYVSRDNRKRPERKRRQRRREADMKDTSARREMMRIGGLEGADMKDTIWLRLDGAFTMWTGGAEADMKDTIVLEKGLLVGYRGVGGERK